MIRSKRQKRQSNDLALQLYPRLKELIDENGDRLYKAFRISVAGNIIDLGIRRSFNIDEELKYSMEIGFAKEQYRDFVKKLDQVDEVLFLGDNSGEIVFDKILVGRVGQAGERSNLRGKRRSYSQ